MGVQVHGQVEALAQRGHQDRGRGRAQQSGHVLDRQDVRAGVHDLLGEVAGSSRGCRCSRPGPTGRRCSRGRPRPRRCRCPGRLDGRPHLVDVVEGVEDAEDVDAGGGGLLDERVGDLGRVRGVADGVASAQQHLQRDVRQRPAERGQPLPGVLAQEAQRDVVGRPAPGLHGEQLRQRVRDVAGGREQVPGAHPGGQQGLVRVAEGGVRDRDRRLLAQGLREALRAELKQALAPAAAGACSAGSSNGDRNGSWRLSPGRRGSFSRGSIPSRRGPLGLFTVTSAQEGQRLGAAVWLRLPTSRSGRESMKSVAASPAMNCGSSSTFIRNGMFVAPRARGTRPARAGPGPRPPGSHVPGGELDQHRVEVRGDLRAGVDGAAVQAHPGPARGAVHGVVPRRAGTRWRDPRW